MSEEATLAPPSPASIIEAFAKNAVVTEENVPVSVPDIKIEAPATTEPVKSDPVTTAATPADTAATPKSEDRPAAPAPEPPKPAEPVKTPEPSWKEVLKKNSPDHKEVLKELGLDDKMVGFFDKWKNGGDVKAYLEAATTDYSKMSAEEIMRHNLKREYPDFDKADFEELYRMKVTEQYKLDPDLFTEQEIRRGNILLQADAKKVRETLTAEQQQYLLPQAPPAAPSNAEQEAEKRANEMKETILRYRTAVEENTATKELLSKKILTVGEGEDAFNYEAANPQDYIDLLVDPEKWAAKLYNEDQTPDMHKQLLLAAIADDPKTFFKEFSKHYKKLGAKEAILPIENPSQPLGTPTRDNPLGDPVAQLAKAGIIVSG